MKILFLISLFGISSVANAQDLNEYHYAEYKEGGHVLPYRILMPLSFDSTKKYPLIIFLHVAFEKGTDNQVQVNIGGRFFLRQDNRSSFKDLPGRPFPG